MKSLSIDNKIRIALVATLASVGLLSFVFIAHANPSALVKGVSTSTATTTANYFTVTATSTLAFDAFQIAGTQPSSNKFDTSTIGIQFTASSTTSVLNWRYEYAIDQAGVDCSVNQLACDWYSDELVTYTNASTTQNMNVPKVYAWTFASSTNLCNSSTVFGTNTRGCMLVSVPTPTRYVRVVFYLAQGSTNGAVWASTVPTRENNTK